MPSLLEERAAAGALPVRAGALTLEPAAVEAITQLMPFAGRAEAVSEALRNVYGVGLPAPNRVEAAGGLRLVWSGLDEALALGPPVAVEGAAVLDQSDGWAPLMLTGEQAPDVLARLCPVDLRPSAFGPGSAARTMLGHASVLLVAEAEGVLILVPRSMATHAVEEIGRAMEAVAARASLAERRR